MTREGQVLDGPGRGERWERGELYKGRGVLGQVRAGVGDER